MALVYTNDDLLARQRRHLENVRQFQQAIYEPCAHNQCIQCHGTGVKLDGSPCVHMIACHCPKCSPRF